LSFWLRPFTRDCHKYYYIRICFLVRIFWDPFLLHSYGEDTFASSLE
jgi:hypothetical protein